MNIVSPGIKTLNKVVVKRAALVAVDVGDAVRGRRVLDMKSEMPSMTGWGDEAEIARCVSSGTGGTSDV